MTKPLELWIIDQYIGHPNYGNVYRNFYISQELQKRDIKIRIFSASYSHLMYNYPELEGKVTTEVLDGVEFNWIKIKRYGGGRSIGRIISIFEFSLKLLFLRRAAPPNVILTPSLSMVPIWPILFMKKFFWKGIPKIIFEIRDIWPLTLTTLGKKSKYSPFILFLAYTERMAYRCSDYIISTLRMCDEHISKSLKKPFRFKWVDNGINVPTEEAEIPEEILSELPLNKFIVGYTGSLGIANAMGYVIEAAKLLKDRNEIHFVIVGDGSERENLIKQSNGLQNITFLLKVNKLVIPSILAKFDILYFSYANEPDLYKYGVSANKTYEYMLSGKPIVLSSVKIRHNIIDLAGCGIVVAPENPELIADAILDIYNMPPQHREQMGKNGKNYIMENNTFQRLAEKVYKVIQELT